MSRLAKENAVDGRTAAIILTGLIIASAVAVDPFGVQSFLLLRYASVLSFLLASLWVLWRFGVAMPTNKWVRIGIVAFLGLVLLAALLGRAPLVAVLGTAGRQMGWVAWVVFAVAFVVGLSLFDQSDRSSMETALLVGFSVALLGAGVIGLLELVGRPLVEMDQAFGARLQSSFGNPAVLGAFVVMALPISVGGVLERRLLPLTISASVVGTGLLVLSGTRGAWIGVAVGFAFALVVVGYRRKSITVARIGVVAAVVVVLLGLTAVTGRWSTAVSGFEGRIATWGVAAEVVAEHPFIGVGSEGFATAFAETVDEEYVVTYTRDDVVDRAHNGILEVAVVAGIPAVAIYLVLVFGVAIVLWNAATGGDATRWVTVGAAAGAAAYIVQQQVLFQLVSIDVVFWLVVGLLTTVAEFASRRRPMRPAVAGVGVFVVAVAAYAFVGVYADHLDRFALIPGDAHVAFDALDRASGLRPSDDIHAIVGSQVSEMVGDLGINARAGRLVDEALSVDATNEILILERSGLLVDVYELSGNPLALDAAQADLDALVIRDTTNGDAFLRLGAIAYHKGDYDLAEQHWLRARLLMPHRHEPPDNLAVLRSADR